MRVTLADIRDTVLITLTCVVAGVLVLAPYNLGVPLCALALSWLAYRHGFPLAVGVALFAGGVLAATLLLGGSSPAEAVMVSAVMLLAGPWAASRMRHRSPWLVFGVIVVAVFGCTFGALAIAQASVGSTLPAFFTEQAKLGAAEAQRLWKSWGVSNAALEAQVATMQLMMAQVLPSVFVLAAALSSLLSVYAVGWVGRRQGQQLNALPPLAELDLTWHLTWGLILGLGGLAVARFTGRMGSPLAALSWNVVVLTRGALFLQGFAVFAGLYRKAKLGFVGRMLGYVLLVITEMVTPLVIPIGLVSLTGLVDLWVNLRKLPRGGEPVPETAGEV